MWGGGGAAGAAQAIRGCSWEPEGLRGWLPRVGLTRRGWGLSSGAAAGVRALLLLLEAWNCGMQRAGCARAGCAELGVQVGAA